MLNERESWYWFANINGIGVRKGNQLLERFGSPYELYRASEKSVRSMRFLSDKDKEEILNHRNVGEIRKNIETLQKKDIYFVTREDEGFPKKLLHIPDVPLALYLKGRMPEEDAPVLAIIGARDCSIYGKETTLHFSKRISEAGVQVISGLARGIDRYAHEGALTGKGGTFGVLGCGIDVCYPNEHIHLYRDVIKNGGILSEYTMGIKPIPGNFPMRNRIISGMSDAILVMEARKKSGSLITADLALEQGKDVYALPGRVGDALSEGTNNLIKMGAFLVDGVEEVLHLMKWENQNLKHLSKNYKISLETNEKIVYACLSLVPKHINQIIKETNMSIMEVSEILLKMELERLVRQVTNNQYIIIC